MKRLLDPCSEHTAWDWLRIWLTFAIIALGCALSVALVNLPSYHQIIGIWCFVVVISACLSPLFSRIYRLQPTKAIGFDPLFRPICLVFTAVMFGSSAFFFRDLPQYGMLSFFASYFAFGVVMARRSSFRAAAF